MKIYLAGPDVFAPDAIQRGMRLKELCAKYGFEGLYPLDNECANAREIFQANLELIRQSDIIMANINDFRGHGIDDGTAFEIGVGYALYKKLYCYRNGSSTLRERIGTTDINGYTVEDFGLPVNLMIGVPTHIIYGSVEDCLKAIRFWQNNVISVN